MATTTSEKELEELKKELTNLRKDMSEIGKTVSKFARSATEEGRERVRSAADQSREQARETWGAFEKEVSDRPMTSLAAAMGIGFILGKLLSR